MSLNFFGNKKFLILLLILILGLGGFFYWQQQQPTPPEKWDTAEVSQREDYKIIKKDDGLLVKNEKAGLSLKVLEGWKFEEDFSSSAASGGVSFASPNMVTATRTSIVEEGCRLKIGVTSIKTNIETIKEETPGRFTYYPGIELIRQEEILLNEKNGVRHVFNDKNSEMNYSIVQIPKNKRMYEIILDSADKNKEKCIQEFEKILDTVTVK